MIGLYHDMQFHYPFSFKRAHTHTKNMVRPIKTAFENQKTTKKNLRPPLLLIKKRHDPPHILPPPPVEKMNGPLRHSDWRVIHVDHHVATPHSVYRTIIYQFIPRYIKESLDWVITLYSSNCITLVLLRTGYMSRSRQVSDSFMCLWIK